MNTNINPIRGKSPLATADMLEAYRTSNGTKKRVLFVITQSEMGGAQRFLLEIVSHLDRQKYDILVATGSEGGNEFLKKLEEIRIQYKVIGPLKRDIHPILDIKSLFATRNLIKEFEPDTLFLSSSKAGFLGSLATVFPSKLRTMNYKLRTVYRIGGWTFNDPWPSWKKKLWITLEKVSAPWKDIIIVNNKQNLDQAQKLHIKPREKLVMVYNGIDIYKLDYLPREEARLKLFEKIARHSGKVFQADTVIGTIANLYPTKDLPNLIRVAEHFKNNESIIFLVIGDGEERPKIEKLIEQNGLKHKVFLMGQLPNARRYISAFDIFVLPSVKEGFPWALIEAMAAKLPVIATRVGAVPEIIQDQKNGFIVEPGNPAIIVARIKEILTNDFLAKELGIQAHQTILFNFPLEKMIRETEALL